MWFNMFIPICCIINMFTFICPELVPGLDNSGKTTIVKRLLRHSSGNQYNHEEIDLYDHRSYTWVNIYRIWYWLNTTAYFFFMFYELFNTFLHPIFWNDSFLWIHKDEDKVVSVDEITIVAPTQVDNQKN